MRKLEERIGRYLTKTSISKNGVTIRLPEERWQHITQRHQNLTNQQEVILNTIANPERIVCGNEGSLMAVQTWMEENKFIVVVYKEIDNRDGFVITAFPTRRLSSINKRRQVWP